MSEAATKDSSAPSTLQPVVLVILDGFGVSPSKKNNAVHLANTPRLDDLFSHHSHTLLEASGPAVGLPVGQIGNSEVGHMTMGCGCVIEQDLVRINAEIESGRFFENTPLVYTLKKAKAAGRPIHLLGLVSDGGVHSHIHHLEALIDMCEQRGVVPVLHAITDGRDTLPREAMQFLRQIQPRLERTGGSIATVMGRYHAMDRDHRWERTEAAWRAVARAQGVERKSFSEAITEAYRRGEGDEFIQPCVLPGAHPLDDDDSMILFNFRNDRPRQLVRALSMRGFDGFDRGSAPIIELTTMTEIDSEFPCLVAITTDRPQTTLTKVVSEHGLRQLHCAETEKYPHVTFFFNGGVEAPLPGEERKLVPSPRVATYDLKPEMSAPEVADVVIQAVKEQKHAFIVVNFANTDMVGHTAMSAPIIHAVETVDREVGRIVDAAQRKGWSVVITADHGNCDEMLDPETQQPNTQHTMNPVPFVIVDKEKHHLASGCNISSVAPTVLELMGLEIPAEMQAPSVIVKG